MAETDDQAQAETDDQGQAEPDGQAQAKTDDQAQPETDDHGQAKTDDQAQADGEADRRQAERPVGIALVVSTLAALALAGVYIAGGQPQAEGALLFVALCGIGVALTLWAKRLLPQGEVTSERGDLPSPQKDREFTEEKIAGPEGFLVRRRSLLRLLGAAAGALSLAALFPIRSLGPSPGRKLERTAWRKGLRLVDEGGKPVRVDTLQVGSILTAFPEGREQAGDSQVVLVRVEPELLRPRKGRETWAPEGIVAYSKVCPHVGCPVGLYQESTHELVCPCHQSTFNVLDGARPQFGPATRSLPQLPIHADPEGFLVADGDFAEPVGPGYWNRK
jgi:ubiquinol-cytochrome c reductase iron-sulfur subunit